MSSEPSSPMHRAWKHHEKATPPPEPEPPPPPPKRVPRVRVVNSRRDRALTKFATTTEALTADEAALLRELRTVSPDAAGIALAKINAAKKEDQ